LLCRCDILVVKKKGGVGREKKQVIGSGRKLKRFLNSKKRILLSKKVAI
jgi:hypothetical protein